MDEKIRELKTQPEREYFIFLGKKIQKNIYPEYVHYLVKFGQLTLGKTKTNKPREWWWLNQPNEFHIRLQPKSINVNEGIVKLIRIFCFRYLFDIGWLFYEDENGISRKVRKILIQARKEVVEGKTVPLSSLRK